MDMNKVRGCHIKQIQRFMSWHQDHVTRRVLLVKQELLIPSGAEN